uniref:OTU domain-containing protein n=1 Tax=Rhabditophanes sp. KR3021 TaxID=114890 RepID=A0AC35U2R8_9BILA
MSASEQVFEEIYTRWPIIYLYHSGSHFELISKISFPDDIGMTPVYKITYPRVTAPSPAIEVPFIRTLRSNTKVPYIDNVAKCNGSFDNKVKQNSIKKNMVATHSTTPNIPMEVDEYGVNKLLVTVKSFKSSVKNAFIKSVDNKYEPDLKSVVYNDSICKNCSIVFKKDIKKVDDLLYNALALLLFSTHIAFKFIRKFVVDLICDNSEKNRDWILNSLPDKYKKKNGTLLMKVFKSEKLTDNSKSCLELEDYLTELNCICRLYGVDIIVKIKDALISIRSNGDFLSNASFSSTIILSFENGIFNVISSFKKSLKCNHLAEQISYNDVCMSENDSEPILSSLLDKRLEAKEALKGREHKYLQKHRNNQTSAVQTIVRELDNANRANARASRTQEQIEADHVVNNKRKKSKKKSVTTLRNLGNCFIMILMALPTL